MTEHKAAYDKASQQQTAAGASFETAHRSIDGIDYTVYVNAPANLNAVYQLAAGYGVREFLCYEGVLMVHPAIEEVAAIGIEDDRMGEELGVVVVPRAGVELAEEDVQRFASDRLAVFKVPRYVWFQEQPLPRTASSKVLKSVLRERYTPH